LSAGSHASATAALLPLPSGAGAEVVAVVPVEALSWHQVDLPKGVTAAAPRLRAVLEGLIEDRLLDEPDTLHFALQPRAKSGMPVWVAVCDRAWLRAHVQALEAAHRPVSRIVPELSPGEPASVHVLGDPDRARLVLAEARGIAVWPLTASALPALAHLPPDLPVLAEPAVAALAEEALQRKVALLQTTQRHLQAAQSPWDLAQFDLASSGRSRAFKKMGVRWGEWLNAPQWRPARWGVLALLLAQLVGLNAWAWKEQRALNAKRDAIRSALTSTFPKLKVIVDAPLQMAREVAALRQATGAASERDLEAILSAISASAPANVMPTAIEYVAGELRLSTATPMAPAEQAPLAAGLQARGLALRSEGNTLIVRLEGTP
jgi:general secretion pathway protein L